MFLLDLHKKRFLLSAILAFCCATLYSQPLKDTIFFINGTKIIGKIKQIKLGVMTFDPDDANDVTVQLRKLKTISGVRTVFRVETVDDKLYFGFIKPHLDPKMIYVQRSTDSIALNIEEISIVYPFQKSILKRFNGTVGLGFSFTKSSEFGRLNYDANINYASRKNVINLNFSGIYTLTDTLSSRDKEDVTIKHNYYFKGNWFSTFFLGYQRNLELGLQRRYQEGIGIGNKFLTLRTIYSWGRMGVVINQEKSTENVSTGTLTELFGQLEVNLYKFEKPKTTVTLTESVYYNLSQAGRFRNDGEVDISIEIFRDFYTNLSLYSNYDSQPPVEGNPNFDYGIVFGINYLFLR